MIIRSVPALRPHRVLRVWRFPAQALGLIALAALTGAAWAQAFSDPAQVSRWMQAYYQSPAPDRAKPALEVLLSDEALLEKKERLDPLVQFFGTLTARNQRVRADVDNLARGATGAAQRDFLARITKAASSPLSRSPPRDPNDLDVLWAEFFATGSEQPLKVILGVLDYGEKDIDLDALVWRVEKITAKPQALRVMRGAAAWSLATNAPAHPRVKALLESARAQTKDPARRKQLEELLAGRVSL